MEEKNIPIRLLRADEIECRVGATTSSACSLLLYKDARVDMKILDAVYGPFGWQREHSIINGNLYCTIKVKDPETGEWVSKQDVGTESNTEKEKGQASDAFKRAGFNWGIGRELYTAPTIWVKLYQSDFNSKNGKIKTKFKVDEIGYDENREINMIVISDDHGTVRYSLNAPVKVENQQESQSLATDPSAQAIDEVMACKTKGEVQRVWEKYKVSNGDICVQGSKFYNAVVEQGTKLS